MGVGGARVTHCLPVLTCALLIEVLYCSFPVPAVSGYFVFKQIRVEGFNVTRWLAQWPQAFAELAQWIKEVCSDSYQSYSTCQDTHSKLAVTTAN